MKSATIKKILMTIVAFLLAFSLLAIGEHHHDDGECHDDCAICMLIHDGVDFVDFTPCTEISFVVLFVLQGVFAFFILPLHIDRPKSRGPPSLLVRV